MRGPWRYQPTSDSANGAPVEQRVNDDGRTYLVVAHYPPTTTEPAAKVTYELALGEVAERVRLSLLAGASRVECEPAWAWSVA